MTTSSRTKFAARWRILQSLWLLAAALPLVQHSSASAASPPRPNVIVIFADDLGYHDLGVQGAREAKTPHIDSLARNGVRFTSGYVTAPLCSPSRAGLMTGRYQQRFGHETNPGVALELDPAFGLPLTESTIANRMKPLGYATGWIGKSHLGAVTNYYHPMRRGFDEFYGFLEGDHDYMKLCAPNDRDPILHGYTNVCESQYLTYAFGREITNYIARHANEPFFIYAPFNAVHTPHSATPELLSRFPANDYPDPNRRMTLAVLAGLDDAVGAIVAQLRALNLETNTLIFFSSDNGGFPPDNYSLNTPLRGMKTQCYEGGIRVPFLMQWKGVLPTNTVVDAPVSTLDILPTAVAAAGGNAPAAWQIDGVNLLPFLNGQTTNLPHANLFWRIETDGVAAEEETSKDGIRAVRSGDWKLIKPGAYETWELYDLASDISESNNLADARPDKVKELIAFYDAWAAQLAEPRYAYGVLNYERLKFVTEDIRIGATNVSYLAAEFLPGGAQVAFQDELNQLWRGELDPISGSFRSENGRDLPIDSGLAPLANSAGGPQWGLSTNGLALFYTKPGSANRLQIWRARISSNTAVAEQLTAGQTDDRFGVRASLGPANASVKLAFSAGTLSSSIASWADETTAPSTFTFPNHAGPDVGNWLPASTDLTYLSFSPFSSFAQIARYHTATQTAQIITDEDNEKAEVWGFLAPEFNHELCYAAVVDRTAIAIYAGLRDNPNGFFRRVVTLTLPTNTTQRFLYSMQPLSGLRGFNGMSYFTCAAFENNDPQNPGDSGIWLFGLGPDTNNILVRRLDAGLASTNRFAGRREPRTFIGAHEVFCYYLSDDGASHTQLRLAKTGLKLPDHPAPASGFTRLQFSRSFTAGNLDASTRLMSGTETMHLAAHQGRLYAGTGSRQQTPYPADTNDVSANWTGAQILVKDSPSAPWRVDELTPPIFRGHLRVEALESFTFTTRANGSALNPPANLLVAGLSDITTNGADIASVRTRLPGSVDGWEHSTVATSTIPAHVISFGSHVDLVTGVHFIFAGLENGEVYRGVLNSNVTGKISWFSNAPELSGGGSITAFAECNRLLYAASGLHQPNSNSPVTGGIYVRVDNSNAWRRIYRWPSPAEVFSAPKEHRLALGLTTVRDPEGTSNQVLLLSRAWPGVIERIDPREGHAVKVELDVRDFFARRWHDDRVRSRDVTIGYTGFTAVTNPVTGEPVQLVGVWIEHPDANAPSFNGSHFLVRHLDGTYEAADIVNDLPGTQLRATRCFAVSPFAEDQSAAFYFGGYDTATTPSTNTAWVMRGDWYAWPGLTITQPNPPEWQLAWSITGTNWLLETSSIVGPLASWQMVLGLSTRSLTDETQSVSEPEPTSFFRLRKP